MAYKRMQTVPNMMISYQAMRLLKYVKDPTERLIVWDTVVNYFEYAREKDSIMDGFQIPNVSEPAYDAIQEMINSIDEGIGKFWVIVDRNKRIRNGDSEPPPQEETTSGRPVVTIGHQSSPVVTNKGNTSEINGIIVNSSINSIRSPYVKKIMESSDKDTYIAVCKILNSYGFKMTEDDYSGVARKIMYECMDEEVALSCIDVCKKDNVFEMKYFFKVYNNKISWGAI